MLTHCDSCERYLDYMRAMGRESSCPTVAIVLREYVQTLDRRGVSPLTSTVCDVEAYLPVLSRLAVSTRSARISTVRGFHQWLQRRGHRTDDPTISIKPPKAKRRVVSKDYLSQQEAMALLETASELIDEEECKIKRAVAHRNLAMVAMALATGRRRAGLCFMKKKDVNLHRQELRVEFEKGKPGRVLPVASWACAIIADYCERSWAVLAQGSQTNGLFPGERGNYVGFATFAHWLLDLQKETCQRNPDLEDLPKKRLCTHALRVTFAMALFEGGCNLRSLNELMLHSKLSTTALYTPVPVEALRRVLVRAHPLAIGHG